MITNDHVKDYCGGRDSSELPALLDLLQQLFLLIEHVLGKNWNTGAERLGMETIIIFRNNCLGSHSVAFLNIHLNLFIGTKNAKAVIHVEHLTDMRNDMETEKEIHFKWGEISRRQFIKSSRPIEKVS